MESTYTTIILKKENQTQAQDLLGKGFFTTELSQDGNLPATHVVSSGAFYNSELNLFINTDIPKKVYFGQNAQEAFSLESLIIINITEDSNGNI